MLNECVSPLMYWIKRIRLEKKKLMAIPDRSRVEVEKPFCLNNFEPFIHHCG